MPPFVNHLLLNKPDRNWDKTPSITSPSPSFSTPFILPEVDEAFLLESARRESNWAAHNINVCGGNAEGLRALIDNKSYWHTEALHYTALLHKHLHQVTDVVAYWQQEAARQKEALALWLALTKHHANDHPGDMGHLYSTTKMLMRSLRKGKPSTTRRSFTNISIRLWMRFPTGRRRHHTKEKH